METSMSTNETRLIPLNKLVLSEANVRRRDRKGDIDALAASIASHGLLQNLAATDGGDGKHRVIAGGRRLAALKLLAKSGAIARDYPVPCQIVPMEAASETSLAENVQRIAMDPIDEADAYAGLVGQGHDCEAISRRFGVARRHVEQRLALAALSPRLKAAWKRGDLGLDAARAFCIEPDHSKQDAVFRSLGKPVTQASSVRSRLMDGRTRSDHRLIRFVGLAAYEAAGGRVLRDLFDTEAAYIEDPGLAAQLAEAKLAAAASEWSAKGWGWAEPNLSGDRLDSLSSIRIYPDWREPTDAEQAELDRIEAEIAALDAALDETSVEDDPRWSDRDDLEAAYETIRQQARTWEPALKALAGVVLSIGHDGELVVSEGHVKAADQKAVQAILRGGAEREEGTEVGSAQAPSARLAGALPKAVVRDLTQVRSRALRAELARHPDTALALCVAALTMRSLRGAELSGIGVSARAATFADDSEFESSRELLSRDAPEAEEAMLGWCLGLDRERLLAQLAVLVAGSVDLTHEAASPHDARRQGTADTLASALGLDMRRHWQAGTDYWARLPKAALLEAIAESPALADAPETRRSDRLKAYAGLKKDALVLKASEAWEVTPYLPDILVTPIAAGELVLTEAASALVAAE
jgi:ParB family chromosome partitioning protein